MKCVAAECTDFICVSGCVPIPNVGLFIKTVPSSAMYKKELCKYGYFFGFPLKCESVSVFNVVRKSPPGAAGIEFPKHPP